MADIVDRLAHNLGWAEQHTARGEIIILRTALREAREFVAADLKGTLECVCVLDKETLEPIESTIDPADVPHVESIRAVLARIDAALKGGAE